MFVDLLGVQSRTAELGYPQCSTVSELLLSAGHASVSGASPQSEPVGRALHTNRQHKGQFNIS